MRDLMAMMMLQNYSYQSSLPRVQPNADPATPIMLVMCLNHFFFCFLRMNPMRVTYDVVTDWIETIQVIAFDTTQYFVDGVVAALQPALMQYLHQFIVLHDNQVRLYSLYLHYGQAVLRAHMRRQQNRNRQSGVRSQNRNRSRTRSNNNNSNNFVPICRDFNQRTCTRTQCNFRHICTLCMGEHPAFRCPNQSNQRNQKQ